MISPVPYFGTGDVIIPSGVFERKTTRMDAREKGKLHLKRSLI